MLLSRSTDEDGITLPDSIVDDIGAPAPDFSSDRFRLSSFKGKPIQIVQQGEMETLACAIEYRASAVVIDERITRLLIENPLGLKNLMEKRLHMSLYLDMRVLKKLKEELSNLIVFRSIELVTISFEVGILDPLIVHIPHAKRELLESVLWGVKLAGCSVGEDEINMIVKKFAA